MNLNQVLFSSATVLFYYLHTRLHHTRKPNPKIELSPHPNRQFTKYIRNNSNDNSYDFYTEQEYHEIKILISQLPLCEMKLIDDSIILKPFQSKSYNYVTDELILEQICTSIKLNDKILGIDIEQTMHNSYQGYICLIQISTINENYIIDAIKLHDVISTFLKPIFQDPNIIKVFYSGVSDLQWLNRDYGIFVVNYFDVYYANLQLNKNGDVSLVELFKKYCNYFIEKETKKKYQISDWRIRPLTQDQLDYACVDAHYLIFLRNVILKQLLITKDSIEMDNFLKKLQNTCLKKYENRILNLAGFDDYFNKELHTHKKLIKKEDHKLFSRYDRKHYEIKLDCFIRLVEYRDQLARTLDENPENICKLGQLFDLSLYFEELDGDVREFLCNTQSLSFSLETHHNHLIKILTINSTEKAKELKSLPASLNYEKKEGRRELLEKRYSAKTKVYEECKLLAPDGELLCYCDSKKIKWYLKNNIADMVSENPLTIKLRFEPGGRGLTELNELKIDRKTYITTNRKNQCVVCGKGENFLRYHVVPKLYRQFFPLEHKAHRAHDVILLCLRCLEKANREADKYKTIIAERYQIPLHEFNQISQRKSALDDIKKQIISYEKNKKLMPEERRKLRKKELRTCFDSILTDNMLDEQFLEKLKVLNYNKEGKVKIDKNLIDFFNSFKNFKTVVNKISNRDFKDMHGKFIVEKLEGEIELKRFIEEWRMLFLETMDPQYLPEDWNIAMKARAEIKIKQINALNKQDMINDEKENS